MGDVMKYPETANRLKKALEDAGINQQTLADKSGVDKTSISQYINGVHKPSTESAQKMANVLNVNYAWLLCHSEYMHKTDIFTGNVSLSDFFSPLPEPDADKYERLENYLQLIGFSYEEAQNICRYARFIKNESEGQT